MSLLWCDICGNYARISVPPKANVEGTLLVYEVQTQSRIPTLYYAATHRVPPVPTSPPQAMWAYYTYDQIPQGDMSNKEFYQFIYMISQLVASQSYQFDFVGSITYLSKVTRVDQFMRLNPPTFIGSKVEEDP